MHFEIISNDIHAISPKLICQKVEIILFLLLNRIIIVFKTNFRRRL